MRPDSARRAAAIAVAGAEAAGWPTSMWMTRPPTASMRAAAAMTSITMNGGTSLRSDGDISPLADSSMEPRDDVGTELLAPLLPHSAVSVPPQGRGEKPEQPGTNLPNLAQ